MKRFYFAILVSGTLILGACDRNGVSPPGSSERAPKVDTSTPDRALKSYWAMIDHTNLLNDSDDTRPNRRKTLFKDILEPSLLDLDAFKRPHPTFARDIESIDVQTESRALIIARIRNTTPMPVGASIEKFDEERRQNGDLYRYVLERHERSWRIAEIWQLDPFDNEWGRTLPPDMTPRAEVFTYEGA